MNIDISKIPWSFFGSRLAVVQNSDGVLYLKDVGGGDEIPSEIFSLHLIENDSTTSNGNRADDKAPLIKANENECCIVPPWSQNAEVKLDFISASQLRVICAGVGIRFEMKKSRYDFIQERAPGIFNIQSYIKDHNYDIDLHNAQYSIDAPWDRVGNKHISISIFDGTAIISDYCVISQKEFSYVNGNLSFSEFLETNKENMDNSVAEATELASYILWSAAVRPHGRLTQVSVYSSKNWMTNIWSWDNCFCALPFAENHPDIALAQMLVFADNQDKSGAYPDFINDRFISFSCTKPPVHGWALCEILNRNSSVIKNYHDEIEYLYNSISASTRFWLTYRQFPSGALFYRHGNDSGWDNATPFMEGGLIESPDLYAFLSKQADSLAELSVVLGKEKKETEQWQSLSKSLIETMLERLWDSEGFFARRGIDGKKIEHRGSFLLRMPIVAYKHIPEYVRKKLIDDIADESRFLAQYGIATESLNSPYLELDGYWRGPVWAPVNYLVADSLMKCGENKLAKNIAQRFITTCKRNGMAENFNPITGKGQDDPAFAWTSAVFLLFLRAPFTE